MSESSVATSEIRDSPLSGDDLLRFYADGFVRLGRVLDDQRVDALRTVIAARRQQRLDEVDLLDPAIWPDAEEVVIVLSGRGWHRVGDHIYDIGPGDVVFVPRNTAHSACCTSDDDLVIIWVLGGAPSLERAGYQSVPELLP